LPDLNFKHFLTDGEAAARERFDSFTLALVRAVRSNVRGMRPAPGDWGIDAFVGDLAGEVAIWQAKFFPDRAGDAQKEQIRKSYKSAKKAASGHDYTVITWTLVLPIELSGEERSWWDKWVAAQKADEIAIELWELSRLQELLRSPEAADVRAEYFPHLDPVHPSQPPEVLEPPDGAVTQDMLFIKQLQAAGLTELETASEQFYNAEILERDLADKRLERQMNAYKGLRSDLRGTWADRFEHHCGATPAGEDRLSALHSDVMERIDAEHLAAPMHPLPLTRTHRKGAMHQIVNRAQAGWTRGYRKIAEDHGG
jgi:hypothetical protein